jgi:hypothetical protein
MGIPRIEPAFGFRVLIGDDHPAIQALDQMIEEFSGGLPVLIAWQCGEDYPCHHALDAQSLSMALAITEELAVSDHVRDIQGPANAPITIETEEGFEIRRFFEQGRLAPDAPALSQQALRDPLWIGELISPDGSVGAIVLQPTDNRASTDRSIMDAIHGALAHFEALGFVYYLAGEAPRLAAGKGLSDSTARLIPVLAFLVAVVLLGLTRSLRQSLITLVTMGLALAWTRGILGWLGWPQDSILEVLAPVIVIVGVCDSIHLLSRYADKTQSIDFSHKPAEAMLQAAGEVGPICLATTATTAAALLSFAASNLDTFIRFGIISAIGVGICLLLTFTLLPLLMCVYLRPRRKNEPSVPEWGFLLRTISRSNAQRRNALLITALSLLAFFACGWTQLKADQDWLESWGEQNSLTKSIRFFENKLGQSQKLELLITLPAGVRLEEPGNLATIAKLVESLSAIEGLGPSTSILTFTERLHEYLNKEELVLDAGGASEQTNAELLELLSFEDADLLSRWVNLDHSKIRVSLAASEAPHSKRIRMLGLVQETIHRTLPSGWKVSLSGDVALSAEWTQDVQNTQLRSFPIAFFIVFLLASRFLNSFILGFAAMVPTLLPVVVVLGSMGWLGMSLDVARAMIAAIVIGIGVDDALHLLWHFKQQMEAGESTGTALEEALLHTGRPIAITSLALSLGFLSLMMSSWQTVASFGFLVALSVLGALVATLFVLPALILSVAPRTDP